MNWPRIFISFLPILQLNPTSIVTLGNQKGNVGSIYPNPSSSCKFNIPITSRSGGEINITLFNLEGKIVSRKQTTINAGKTNYLYSDNKLIPNTYIVLIKTPEGNIAQQVIVD